MSKTKFVSCGDDGFWAYDVALGVFMKYVIDAAEAPDDERSPWLSGAISDWRLSACFPDHGLTLDPNWSSPNMATFIDLANKACDELSRQDAVSAEEIASWTILEDLKIFTRGASEVETRPVVELGRAIVALAKGVLPAAPQGTIWLYGAPTGRTTLLLRS